MSKLSFLCVLLLIAAQASATTALIESFNGAYVGGPIGPMPAGWTFLGFGPPAYNTQETGLVLPPNDGTNSAWRIDIPDVNEDGLILIYKLNMDLDTFALPGEAIDWNQPVYLKADVYAVDKGFDTTFKTTIHFNGTPQPVEWGSDGVGNSHWETVTTQVSDPTAHMVLQLDFSYANNYPFEGLSTVIWENLRMEYTAVPEPTSLLLVSGLAGLGFIRRTRRRG